MLKVTDTRTGDQLEVPITDGTVPATAFGKLAATVDGKTKGPLRVWDSGLRNTATARSAITYIDGDAGVLRYRGYAIEELCEKSSFLEVAFLLVFGNLVRDALHPFIPLLTPPLCS